MVQATCTDACFACNEDIRHPGILRPVANRTADASMEMHQAHQPDVGIECVRSPSAHVGHMHECG